MANAKKRTLRHRLNRQIVRMLAIFETLDQFPGGLTAPELFEEMRGDSRMFSCCMRTVYRDLDAAVFAGVVTCDYAEPAVYKFETGSGLHFVRRSGRLFDEIDGEESLEAETAEWIQLYWQNIANPAKMLLISEGGPFANARQGLDWLVIVRAKFYGLCPNGWQWAHRDSEWPHFRRAQPAELNRSAEELVRECKLMAHRSVERPMRCDGLVRYPTG